MMHQVYGTDSRHIRWLYLFLGGFLIGILGLNIGRDFFLQDMELLNVSSLSRLRYMEINNGTFFLYVFCERMETVLLLCLLSTTYLGIIAVYGYTLGMGMVAGVVLSVASIRYGLKGILLILASIFPQYLFLVPACIMLMGWCCRLCTALYHPERSSEMGIGIRKQYLLRKVIQIMIIIGIIFVGCIVESYINPMILSAFLNFF